MLKERGPLLDREASDKQWRRVTKNMSTSITTSVIGYPGYLYTSKAEPIGEDFLTLGLENYLHRLLSVRDLITNGTSAIVEDLRSGRGKLEIHNGTQSDVESYLTSKYEEVEEYIPNTHIFHAFPDPILRLYLSRKPDSTKMYSISSIYPERLKQLEKTLRALDINPNGISNYDHSPSNIAKYTEIFDQLMSQGQIDTLIIGARHGIINTLLKDTLINDDQFKKNLYSVFGEGAKTLEEKLERLVSDNGDAESADRLKSYFRTPQFKRMYSEVDAFLKGDVTSIDITKLTEFDEMIHTLSCYPDDGMQKFRLFNFDYPYGIYDPDYGRFDVIPPRGLILSPIPYGKTIADLVKAAKAAGIKRIIATGTAGVINNSADQVGIGDLIAPSTFSGDGEFKTGMEIQNIFTTIPGLRHSTHETVESITDEDCTWVNHHRRDLAAKGSIMSVDVEMGHLVNETINDPDLEVGILLVATDIVGDSKFNKLRTETEYKAAIANGVERRDKLLLQVA